MSKEWKAQWLQDPRFDGLEPIDTTYLWRDRDEAVRRIFAQHKPGLSNLHLLLRKRFHLAASPAEARLWITADDYYKLWINSRFVGQGPASSYPWHYYYNEWDISPFLQDGENVIGVHVYYQGLVTRVWNSLDHRMGMVAEADISLDDGRLIQVLSDASWRSATIGKETTVTLEDYLRRRSPVDYYRPGHSGGMIGSLTQFQENVDERAIEYGWRGSGFDDSHWSHPSAVDLDNKDYVLFPQPTPPLQFQQIMPECIQERGEGRYLLDFGRQVAGRFGLRQPGHDGHVLEIRHAEELTDEGDVRVPMRCNCDYREYWTLAGRPECVLEPYDYKSFRYVEVCNPTTPPTTENAWVTEQAYPWPGSARFQSSMELLDRIWDLCVLAVRLCSQEGYLDCPQREKGQYLGDSLQIAHAHVLLTGDTRLYRKAIQQFAHSARITPGLKCIAPGNFMNELVDYSLQFPMHLEAFYGWTGDLGFVRELLPVAEGMLDYFQQHRAEGGLLAGVTEMLNFVDHGNLRDGYDFPLGQKGTKLGQAPHAVLNAHYLGSMACVSRLRHLLGQEPAEAGALRDAFLSAFLREDLGVFVDAPGSAHRSLHANALALYYDLVPEWARRTVVELLRRKRLACSPYMAYYLLRALCRVDETSLAFDLITCRDKNSWHSMLEANATSAMEVWTTDLKRNVSFCHAWSSVPVPIIVEKVMGLQSMAPARQGICFDPWPPQELDWADLEVPYQDGIASVSFSRQGGETEYELCLPAGMELCVPNGSGLLLLGRDRELGRYRYRKAGLPEGQVLPGGYDGTKRPS
jgi:hypothetical protein